MKPTEKQMRAIENHINKAERFNKPKSMQNVIDKVEQIKRLKTIFKHEAVETCNSCGLEHVPLMSYGGESLCPKCDEELINKYFDKLEKVA